jgi:hypothetical protein
MADTPGTSSSGGNRDVISGAKKASSSALLPSELTRPMHLARINNRKSQLKSLPRQKKLEKLATYSQCKVKVKLTSLFYYSIDPFLLRFKVCRDQISTYTSAFRCNIHIHVVTSFHLTHTTRYTLNPNPFP